MQERGDIAATVLHSDGLMPYRALAGDFQAAAALNQKRSSGSFTAKLGAARHFGLATTTAGHG